MRWKQVFLFLTPGDKFLIILIFLLGSLNMVILPRIISPGSYLLIEASGKTTRFSLNDSRIVFISGRKGNLELEIASGKVRVRQANCPNQICVRSGWISRTGQTIICVPNQVILRIEGEALSPVDAVGY